MGKAMGVVMGVVAIAIVFIVFPIILNGVDEIQTDVAIQTAAGVETTSGTTATLTLSTALFATRAADISAISSDESGDTPTVSTVSNGTVVVIGGLATSATRDLGVTYYVDALTDYTGLSSIVGVSPMLIFIGILGIVIGGAFYAWKHGG